MGVNKIDDMMKSVIKGMTLEDSWKTFSNNSARKTVVKKFKTAGLERGSGKGPQKLEVTGGL